MYLFNYIGIMAQINVPYLKCLRCNHKWIPRSNKYPKVCPNCNSPYWNKDRRKENMNGPKKKINKEKDNRDLGEITELAHDIG